MRMTTILIDLIDLDGTLIDPKRGIAACIQHALHRLGRPAPHAGELDIGPEQPDELGSVSSPPVTVQPKPVGRRRAPTLGTLALVLERRRLAFLAAGHDDFPEGRLPFVGPTRHGQAPVSGEYLSQGCHDMPVVPPSVGPFGRNEGKLFLVAHDLPRLATPSLLVLAVGFLVGAVVGLFEG